MTARAFKRGLGWLVGAALLAWLLHALPLGALPRMLERIGLGTWLVALAALVASYAMRVARFQVVLLPGASKWRTRKSVWRVMLFYNAAINLLPFRGGELSFPWLAARELGTSTSDAVAAWLWMRLQDVAVLGLLAVLAWPGLPNELRAGTVLAWLLGILSIRPVARTVLVRWQPAEGATGWRRFAGQLRTALADGAHHHPLAWVYTAANWCIKMAGGAWLVSAACGTSFLAAWAGMLGGEIASILPVQGPAGFGTYEAGVHAGMAWLGGLGAATPADTVLAALCWHLTMLLTAVVGGAWAGLRPGGPTSLPGEQET